MNQVESLQDMRGTVHKDMSEMENVVLQYFTDIFSSTQPDGALRGDVLNAIEPRVSGVANHRLTHPFTAKEVTDALLVCPSQISGPR